MTMEVPGECSPRLGEGGAKNPKLTPVLSGREGEGPHPFAFLLKGSGQEPTVCSASTKPKPGISPSLGNCSTISSLTPDISL
jgi:hypothetical protein